MYKKISVSQFHIHHNCQSRCGVQRESLLKRRIIGCMVMTKEGEITCVECTVGVSGLKQVFIVLIRGWLVVFTSGT